MAVLSKFGKEIRKLRIEHGETMMDMARKLDRSPSFLSAVETGAKTIPDLLVEQIASAYSLKQADIQRLKAFAFESAKTFKITPHNTKEQELVAAFARKLDSLSDVQRDRMMKLLKD